jgi:hypothetical protein
MLSNGNNNSGSTKTLSKMTISALSRSDKPNVDLSSMVMNIKATMVVLL